MSTAPDHCVPDHRGRTPRRRAACRWAALACLLPWLAACGGGGGGDDGEPPAPPVTAEGLWVGATSDGHGARLLVLQDGRLWGFFSRDGALSGALALRLRQDGTAFSVAGSGLALGRTVPAGPFSGQVLARQSLSLSFADGTRLALSYSPAYASPASAAAIAGSYAIAGHTAAHTLPATPAQVDAQGNFSVSAAGCAMHGSLRPAADGKGYYDAHVAFSGRCSPFADGATLDGVALADTAASPHTLVAIVTRAESSYLLTLQAAALPAP